MRLSGHDAAQVLASPRMGRGLWLTVSLGASREIVVRCGADADHDRALSVHGETVAPRPPVEATRVAPCCVLEAGSGRRV